MNRKKLEACGIIDDAKQIFNKTKSDANDLFTKVLWGRTDLSPKCKKILEQHGQATILYARVGRKPITSAIWGMPISALASMWAPAPSPPTTTACANTAPPSVPAARPAPTPPWWHRFAWART